MLTDDQIKLLIGFGQEPLNDRVVVKQLEAETITKGGIIIPDTAREKPQKGIVVALGPDVNANEEHQPRKTTLDIGDIIYYGKYAGTEHVGEDGEEYIVMRVHDIATRKFKTQ